MATILIIDDDPAFCTLLGAYLQQQGHAIEVSPSGEQALDVLGAPDHSGIELALLDIALPGMDGFQTLKKIRDLTKLPVIILSQSEEDPNKLLGLELGADDYVAKRANPQELAARVSAVLRRAGSDTKASAPPGDRIQIDDVVLARSSRKVTVDGRVITLTGIEFDLLDILMRGVGQIISRVDLSQRVIGRQLEPFDRSVDVHVSRLRQKLGTLSSGRPRIESIRGKGYIYLTEG